MSLATIAASYGANVQLVDGASLRGSTPFTPAGILVHHTASPALSGDVPCAGLVVHGRADLPGPLCNLLVGRAGTVLAVAERAANHAGLGSGRVLAEILAEMPPDADAAARGLADTTGGNSSLYGIEVECDGVGEPLTAAARDSLVKVCAGLCSAHGWSANRIRHHRQWTARKPDMSDRSDIWASVRNLLAGSAPPISDDEELDDMAAPMIFTTDRQTFYVRHPDGIVSPLPYSAQDVPVLIAQGAFGVFAVTPANQAAMIGYSERKMAGV